MSPRLSHMSDRGDGAAKGHGEMDMDAIRTQRVATLTEVQRLADTLTGLGLGAEDALGIAGHALTGGAVGDRLFALRRAGAIDSTTLLAAYCACRDAA